MTRRLQQKIAKRVNFLEKVAASRPAPKLGVQQGGTKKKRSKDRGPGRLGDLSNLTASLAEAAQQVVPRSVLPALVCAGLHSVVQQSPASNFCKLVCCCLGAGNGRKDGRCLRVSSLPDARLMKCAGGREGGSEGCNADQGPGGGRDKETTAASREGDQKTASGALLYKLSGWGDTDGSIH